MDSRATSDFEVIALRDAEARPTATGAFAAVELALAFPGVAEIVLHRSSIWGMPEPELGRESCVGVESCFGAEVNRHISR